MPLEKVCIQLFSHYLSVKVGRTGLFNHGPLDSRQETRHNHYYKPNLHCGFCSFNGSWSENQRNREKNDRFLDLARRFKRLRNMKSMVIVNVFRVTGTIIERHGKMTGMKTNQDHRESQISKKNPGDHIRHTVTSKSLQISDKNDYHSENSRGLSGSQPPGKNTQRLVGWLVGFMTYQPL